MQKREYANSEKKRFYDFCKKHSRIYIYGSGKYGERYLEILHNMGFEAAGFITTKHEKTEYCGIPVYSVRDISVSITDQDGIIPAYSGASQKEIERYFRYEKPDILIFDHKMMFLMQYEIHISPIIKSLGIEFPPRSAPSKRYTDCKNMLLVRLDAIGDVVCITAFIRELKRNCPDGTVTVVIREENQALLKRCPYIDELILYKSTLKREGILEQCKDFEKVKDKISEFAEAHFSDIHFDMVFLLTEILCGRNGLEEFLMAFYSRADYRIGRLVDIDILRESLCCMTKNVFSTICYQVEPMHETLFLLDMLKKCGFEVENDRIELWPDKKCCFSIKDTLERERIKNSDTLIAVGLIGSVPQRSWKVENYDALFRAFKKIYKTRVKFIILGGKDAVPVVSNLKETGSNVVNMVGKLSLELSIACIQKCDLYVGSNTGLLHIATALGKPSVTLYSELSDGSEWDGDSPTRYGARGVQNIALIPPAGLDGCHGFCRKNYSHCINQITPLQVGQAIESLLGGAGEKYI